MEPPPTICFVLCCTCVFIVVYMLVIVVCCPVKGGSQNAGEMEVDGGVSGGMEDQDTDDLLVDPKAKFNRSWIK